MGIGVHIQADRFSQKLYDKESSCVGTAYAALEIEERRYRDEERYYSKERTADFDVSGCVAAYVNTQREASELLDAALQIFTHHWGHNRTCEKLAHLLSSRVSRYLARDLKADCDKKEERHIGDLQNWLECYDAPVSGACDWLTGLLEELRTLESRRSVDATSGPRPEDKG